MTSASKNLTIIYLLIFLIDMRYNYLRSGFPKGHTINYGRKRTKETKAKIGVANKAKMLLLWKNPIHRERMILAHKGRKSSKGKVFGWSTGLTKETHPGLMSLSVKLAISRIGQGNPMYGRKAWNSGKKLPQFSGENHPNWIKDRTKIKAYQSERNNAEYKQWRMKVLKIYAWQCLMCGQKKSKMIADHVYSWANYLRIRYCVENGQALCEDCHKIKTRYENMINTNIIYSTIWEK